MKERQQGKIFEVISLLALVAVSGATAQAAPPNAGWHGRTRPTAPATSAPSAAAKANANYGSNWAITDLAVGPNNLMHALWVNTNGAIALWVVNNNGSLLENNTYGPYPGWSAQRISVGGDGETRVLWDNTDGTTALWQVAAGDQTAGGGGLRINWTFGPYSGWTAQTVAAGPDNKMRVMWERDDGMLVLWQLGYSGNLEANNGYGPFADWFPQDMAVGPDNLMRVLWDHLNGTVGTWLVSSGSQVGGGGQIVSSSTYGPYAGWTAGAITVGGDSLNRIAWSSDQGQLAVWQVAGNGQLAFSNTYGPYYGWLPQALAAGVDSKARIAWSNTNGQAALWQIGYGAQSQGGGQLELNLSYGPY